MPLILRELGSEGVHSSALLLPSKGHDLLKLPGSVHNGLGSCESRSELEVGSSDVMG